jgi:beta-lactamase class A
MKSALTILTRVLAACATAATVVLTLALPAPAAPLPPPGTAPRTPSGTPSGPGSTPAGPSWPQLSRRLEAVVNDAADAGVTMSVTVKDLSGAYHGKVAGAGADETVKAASIIKLPLLALLMDRVDHGTLSLDTVVTIPAGDPNIVGGSGTLRTRSFPLDITVRELMELMVQVSDNTATNVLIDVAGGFPAVNAYIDHLGFTTLHLGRKMIQPANPPVQENYADSREVTELLTMIWQGKILSRQSSDHIITLMKGQSVNTKYGAVIPRQYLANKTGELDDVSHDSGYILLPGREVALATTTSFSGVPRSVADVYVQRTATVVYEWLHQPVPGRR